MSKLPEGYYQGRVVSGEGQFGETSKGTIEAVIPFLLEDDSFEGPERVTVRLYFSEKAEEYSVKKLRAIGWKGGDLTFADCPNLVTIAVKYEEYNGEERQKCDIALGGGTKPLDPARERAFAAKLAGLVGVTAKAPGAGLDGLD
jgi:hypothetical protein